MFDFLIYIFCNDELGQKWTKITKSNNRKVVNHIHVFVKYLILLND